MVKKAPPSKHSSYKIVSFTIALPEYIDFMKYTPQSSDKELIKGCRKGHRLAQKQLYERFTGKMTGIAMRYTSNKEEAFEILNNAFLKVFTSLDKYKDENNLAGWIARIVFNTAIDHVRKHTRYRKVMDFNVEKDASISNEALDNLIAEDLYDLVQALPQSSRTVFSLYVVEGYKHREIAELLGISEGTSKWHLASARKELQKRIRAQRASEAVA